jgi:SAM-dependent methyltransferase
METTVKLSDEQVERFVGAEYVRARRWDRIRECIDADFPGGRFSFLDVGGGNGGFTDRVLAQYPNATGTVIDSSDLLLATNRRSERKRVLRADAMELERFGRHDIVFCNWLLHHLVGTTYSSTRANIDRMLAAARQALKPSGRLSVFENDCIGIIDGMSSRLLYEATSSKIAAALVRRMGANTAGVGVCYLSNKQWHGTLAKAGFRVLSCEIEPSTLPAVKRWALLIRTIQVSHYWAC